MEKLHKFVSIFEVVFFILMTYFFVSIPFFFKAYVIFIFFPVFFKLWKCINKNLKIWKWVVFIISIIVYWLIYYYVVFMTDYIQDKYCIENIAVVVAGIGFYLVVPIVFIELLKKFIKELNLKNPLVLFGIVSYGFFVLICAFCSLFLMDIMWDFLEPNSPFSFIGEYINSLFERFLLKL